MTLTESTLTGLSKFITDDGIFGDEQSIPELLADHDEYFDDRKRKQRCIVCGGEIRSRLDRDGGKQVVCENGDDYFVPANKTFTYRLQLRPVLVDICETIGYENVAVETEDLPAYAYAEVDDDCRICLACDTQNYEETLDKLFVQAVKNQRVNAVLTPHGVEGKTWETASKYPLGSFAPTFPLEMLTDPKPAYELIEAARLNQDRLDHFQEQREWNSGELYKFWNQNPRQIQTGLQYSRVFRETTYSGNLPDRFEDVCKAAFATMDYALDIESGGTTQRGGNVPDIEFRIPSSPWINGYDETVFGVVDAKSAAEADIKDEDIPNKHLSYIRQTDVPVNEGDHLAHIFVVFSLKGLDANEIDWFDALEAEVGSDMEFTMTVLKASALSQMVGAHLSVSQRNEMNLAMEQVSDVFRPFFQHRLFRNFVDEEIQTMTRVDSDDPTSDEQQYMDRYQNRGELIVVTKEMVDQRIRNVVEDYSMVEDQLSYSPNPWA